MINRTGLLLAFLLFVACTSRPQSPKGKQPLAALPHGYSFATMKTIVLDDELDEISGIAWDQAQHQMLAEEDEDGLVYVLDKEYQVKGRYRFAKKGDYEDIVLAGNELYLLRSDGRLYEVTYRAGIPAEESVKYDYEGATAEFESVIPDKTGHRLLLIEKTPPGGKHSGSTPVIAFDLATRQFAPAPVRSLSWDELSRKAGYHLSSFNPSGAAVHPITGDIYLVASIQKILVTYDRLWRLKSISSLDPKRFRQPEGITFDATGNLYISNEAAGKRAVLQVLPYKP